MSNEGNESKANENKETMKDVNVEEGRGRMIIRPSFSKCFCRQQTDQLIRERKGSTGSNDETEGSRIHLPPGTPSQKREDKTKEVEERSVVYRRSANREEIARRM